MPEFRAVSIGFKYIRHAVEILKDGSIIPGIATFHPSNVRSGPSVLLIVIITAIKTAIMLQE